MPIELQVIRASEFIRLNAQELLDFEASKQVLQSLARAFQKRGLNYAMLDLRQVPVPAKPSFTTDQLAALVGSFREAGFSRQQRLAILYRQDVHGGVRSFAFISRLRGLKVQAFHDFEAAFNWLAEESPSRHGRPENEIPIPITKRPGEVKKVPVSLIAEKPGRWKASPVRGARVRSE